MAKLHPREDERLTYPLTEILFLVLAGVLCGAENWRKIIRYGDNKLHFLRKFFPFEQGIPTRFTLMRVFSMLDKRQLECWLLSWTAKSLTDFEGELIAIDGKALRGASKGGKRESSLYLLNAFATKQGLVIGHQAINEKTNEITAIPELLDAMTIDGSVVSIDAIGCQKVIANKIIEKKANYFLALKGNQPELFDDVKTYFSLANNSLAMPSYAQTIEKGHGRVETRCCWSTQDTDWLKKRHPDWRALKSICKVESRRYHKGVETIEARYYLSSCAESSEQLLNYSRRHWAIENTLHWTLDVQLNEDSASMRAKNASENMGVIRKIIINLVKRYKGVTKHVDAVSTIRLEAGWNNDIAGQLLGGLVF